MDKNLIVSLSKPYPQTAKAGEVCTLTLPSTNWLDVGIYANSQTKDGAEVELLGGGYRKVGATRLTHFYMKGGTCTVKALDANGFDIVVKVGGPSAAKMASRQQKV